MSKNRKLFDSIRAKNLPIDQYAITGSGAMGIRGLREIGDIDIIVTEELWQSLSKKYEIIDENNVLKIVIPDSDIEVLGENSFYAVPKEADAPSFVGRIKNADIIEGLPFETLEHVIYYKKKMGRDKDLKDITLIEEYRKK